MAGKVSHASAPRSSPIKCWQSRGAGGKGWPFGHVPRVMDGMVVDVMATVGPGTALRQVCSRDPFLLEQRHPRHNCNPAATRRDLLSPLLTVDPCPSKRSSVVALLHTRCTHFTMTDFLDQKLSSLPASPHGEVKVRTNARIARPATALLLFPDIALLPNPGADCKPGTRVARCGALLLLSGGFPFDNARLTSSPPRANATVSSFDGICRRCHGVPASPRRPLRPGVGCLRSGRPAHDGPLCRDCRRH